MIQICYCGNKRIFKGVLLSVMSLIKNTDEPLDILLCTMNLEEVNPLYVPFTEEQRALVDRLLKEKNPESCARIVDMTKTYAENVKDGVNQKNMYTPYAYIRLLLDFYETEDKLIYIDADVMSNSDIKELYSVDVSDYEFAASLDKMGHFWINKNYCNSGVLLLNMKKIRETGLFARSREMIKTKRLVMPDQSALNELAEAKLILPYKFNEQRDIKEDTVLKHFCKGFRFFGIIPKLYNYKQWEIDKVHKYLKIHEFDEIYEEYGKLLSEESELINV